MGVTLINTTSERREIKVGLAGDTTGGIVFLPPHGRLRLADGVVPLQPELGVRIHPAQLVTAKE